MLNYGVGAYGLDQAYLRYLQLGANENPHVVFIGYMSENISRNVNRFRGFYTRFYRTTIRSKPRFLVQDGRLVLLENPLRSEEDYRRLLRDDRSVLRELGQNDYHYRIADHAGPLDFLPSVRLVKLMLATLRRRSESPIYDRQGRYVPTSEAFEVTSHIFDAFCRDVLEQGALPVIVVFGEPKDQDDARRRKPRRYQALLDVLEERGHLVIDTMDALEAAQDRYSVKELTVAWGHYSPVANHLTAQYMAEKIEAWGLEQPETRGRLIEEARRRLQD